MFANLARIQEIAGTGAALQAAFERLGGSQRLVSVMPAEMRHPVHMRVRTSDVSAYQQIFLRREYAFAVNRPPRTIIDAGANVGYASAYLADRYPAATIIAIEPEPSNFELLRRNTRAFPNVHAVLGALWPVDGELNLIARDTGHWGFMTQPAGEGDHEYLGEVAGATPAISVPTLLKRFGVDRVDVFKIDIEGAERELFADAGEWLPKVDALIIELHDHKKPGCEESFWAATAGFGAKWRNGENVYLARPESCLAAPAA